MRTPDSHEERQDMPEPASSLGPTKADIPSPVPASITIGKQLALQRVFGVPNGIDFMAAQSEAGFRITFGN